MKKRERRSFDKAFKLMVVELHNSGKSFRAIGRELDLPADMVSRRSRELTANGKFSFAGNGITIMASEQEKIARLKKALKEGEIERDILKRPSASSLRATTNIAVHKRPST